MPRPSSFWAGFFFPTSMLRCGNRKGKGTETHRDRPSAEEKLRDWCSVHSYGQLLRIRCSRSRLPEISMRVKERILIALCGIALTAGAANAQVIIHAGPPPAVIVERPGPPLHPGWVWVGGYY